MYNNKPTINEAIEDMGMNNPYPQKKKKKQKPTTDGWQELVANMPPPEPMTRQELLQEALDKITEASERAVWWRKENLEVLRNTLDFLEDAYGARIIIVKYKTQGTMPALDLLVRFTKDDQAWAKEVIAKHEAKS